MTGQYDIYIPLNKNDFSYFYYNKNNSLIYAVNDLNDNNCVIIDVNNHYTIIHSDTCNSTNYITLIDKNNITNSNLYRKDVLDVCFLVIIFSTFFFFIPINIFSKLFKRGLR